MLVIFALLPHSFLYIYPFTLYSVYPGNLVFLLLIFTYSTCFHLSLLCVPNFVFLTFSFSYPPLHLLFFSLRSIVFLFWFITPLPSSGFLFMHHAGY